ncbi:MAG: hypothetical protein HC840_09830 [Leptolyngbyaceae cyanobacterium RM2_2_4]|nr:hypothetical protein [Leptolyngbyaceae cyanobacterium RM2_2_4]
MTRAVTGARWLCNEGADRQTLAHDAALNKFYSIDSKTHGYFFHGTKRPQKRVMEHLARSTGDFIKPTIRLTDQRKQQIMDHIRRTKG